MVIKYYKLVKHNFHETSCKSCLPYDMENRRISAVVQSDRNWFSMKCLEAAAIITVDEQSYQLCYIEKHSEYTKGFFLRYEMP